MLVARQFLPSALMHPSVNYVATLPGAHGVVVAWLAEFAITFVLMTTLLTVNRRPKLAPWSGCFAGGPRTSR